MGLVKLKEDIFWTGAVDWDVRNFHGYSTSRGTSYNSYLIRDESTVLIDTVKSPFLDDLMAGIKSVTGSLEKLDYIVVNHAEMDHSGCLPEIMKNNPRAVILTSPNGERSIKAHYGAQDWNIRVVNSGEKISIGKRTLQFFLMPMVHWPDSMAVYVPEEKILFSNDAFGQHIASVERFDDEFSAGIVEEEAAKYYANIVMPYGGRVLKVLEALSGLDIETAAPSHGLIWTSRFKRIAELYTGWAEHKTIKKAVVVFDSMWGSTAKMAGAVSRAFEHSSIKAVPMNLSFTHISDVMTEVLDAEYVCAGSPTLNNGMLPSMGAFLTYMKGLAPAGRKGLAFGSYGWGGQSVAMIDEIFKSSGFETLSPVKRQWVPVEKDLEMLKEKVSGEIADIMRREK